MVDVSKTIVSGDWMLTPRDGKVGIEIYCFTPQMWMTDQQARDLASALQVWIERNAVVE